MKTIRCILTKACQILATFTESLYKNMRILPSKNHEISPVYRRILRSSVSLVYVRSIELVSILTCDPHSKGYSSISILYFSLGLVPVLRLHIVLYRSFYHFVVAYM